MKLKQILTRSNKIGKVKKLKFYKDNELFMECHVELLNEEPLINHDYEYFQFIPSTNTLLLYI